MTSRTIDRSIKARQQEDGDGARGYKKKYPAHKQKLKLICVFVVIYRSIGHYALKNLDPFLMLDEFDVRPPGGFPSHPHRGYETVTFMLEGEFLHEDFRGHSGRLGPGDIQWLSAARGVVHKELPANNRHNHGVQLWINLSKEYKMAEPTCQEFTSDQLPHVSPAPGIDITVLAGTCHGISSPITMRTPTLWIQVKMEEGAYLDQEIPSDYTALVYTLSGSAKFGGFLMSEPHYLLTMTTNGTKITIESMSSDTHFFIIAGKPIKEPVVQLGPFVTNTKQEIYQSFMDYQHGRNGFEGAPEWISLIV